MIVCRECGHRNDDVDQFCGSCGAFLEFSGDRIEPAAASVPTPTAAPAADPEFLRRAKQALSVDDDTLTEQEQTQARVEEEDRALAARIVAEREAAEAAAAAEAAEREAAERRAAQERQQQEAAERTAAAERELAAIQEANAREAAEREAAAKAAEAAAEARRQEEIRRAEDAARAEAERRQQELAAQLAAEEREAEERGRAAAAAAEAAKQREAEATATAAEAARRLEEASAAAAAASLRAMQEADAVARADAAREASEAEAARARAESAAAAAAAAEEVARARAEAEAARAEAAALRSSVEAEAARTSREREEAQAAAKAEEEAARARRAAEADAAAERQRLKAEADAKALRDAADAQAAERRAAAELAARQAEAKAAAARAEEEKARAAAAAEAAKREREEALRRAAALVAPAASTPASSAVTPGAAPATPAKKSAPATPKKEADRTAAAEPAGDGTPGTRLPGATQSRAMPKQVVAEDVNPGDLVCGQCGVGNLPTRKFCRRCGASLAEAAPVKLGFFARMKAKRRAKKGQAGSRKRRNQVARSRDGLSSQRGRGRVAFFRFNSVLVRIGGVLGILAVLGFGVEPIRSKLQLPNVRQKVIDAVRRNATPTYDPVRPSSASASTSASGTSAAALIDLANNTAWMAAPTASGGVGATGTIRFDKPVDLARILLTSGRSGSDQEGEGFVSQPRPSELRFVFDDDQASPVTVKVKDTAEPQTLKVGRKQVTTVVFEVTGVYPSANGKGKSVAITEMEFFEKRKFGDDYETLAPPTVKVTSEASTAAALTDDDLSTAWTSSADADGVGQGFSIVFDSPTDLDRIRFAPGHAEDTFQSSPRPKEIQLAITCEGRCDATKQITLKDKPGLQSFGLSATGVTRIDVVVRTVNGTGGGVAFAELQLQRKRPTVK